MGFPVSHWPPMRAFNPQELPLRILEVVSTGAATRESDLMRELRAGPSSKGPRTTKKHIDATLSVLIDLGLVDASPSEEHSGEDDPHGLSIDRELTISRHCVELIQALKLNLGILMDAVSPGAMVVKPLFGPIQQQREARARPEIFVAMPFREDLEYIFSSYIKPVALGLRMQAVRGDNWEAEHFIVANIWNGIGGSRLVVADCTGNNPNVMYEIGLAHSIGKPVVIITQSPDDIPHDIRHIRYIAYSCDQEGLERLRSSLGEAIRASLSLDQS